VRIDVLLEPGWGAFLYVGDPDWQPLEGVEVFLDGLATGKTTADGHLAIGSADRPERITLRYGDWSIIPDEGEVHEDGTFEDDETRLRACLAPPGR